jgi:hypothetical protein
LEKISFIKSSSFILYVQGARTASERDFSAPGYTVWDKRNAFLPRKVNMMMVLKQFWQKYPKIK